MSEINLTTLDVKIPLEISQAADRLNQWAQKEHIGFWQLGGVCSRAYASALERYAPDLIRVHGHVSVNGGRHAMQKHNIAVNALRSLVPKKTQKILPIHFEE